MNGFHIKLKSAMATIKEKLLDKLNTTTVLRYLS